MMPFVALLNELSTDGAKQFAEFLNKGGPNDGTVLLR